MRSALMSRPKDSTPRSVADVLHRLGDIAPERLLAPFGTATEADVRRLIEGANKRLCELVDGYLVEKVMGNQESFLAGIFCECLRAYARKHDLGFVLGADALVRLTADRIRMPDVGFFPWSQVPDRRLTKAALRDVIPDLAIEILSDSNTPAEMREKLKDFFGNGVKLVWYLYPDDRSVEVYTSPSRKKKVGIDGALDGGKILPGFTLPLKTVFDELGDI
jgi:Uma2 family endonuclease